METPQLFGMHPNAEIGYLTASATNMFNTILSLTGGIGGGSGGGDGDEVVKDKDTIVRETIEVGRPPHLTPPRALTRRAHTPPFRSTGSARALA